MWLAAPQAASAASLYRIDQRFGSVEFVISTLGMFDVQGRFPQFKGEILLDAKHPDQAHIDVAIDANSVEMPLQDQTNLLRSPDYFDVGRHPTERFVSTSIQTLSPSHYLIHGALEIRGVTQSEDLDAVLQDRQMDPALGVETAYFVVTGTIMRSAFGMVADRPMLSDTVHLRIRIHLRIDKAGNDG